MTGPEPAARPPLRRRLGLRELPARGWFLLRRAAGSLFESQGHRYAAQLAFFTLLSFPAALLLATWAFSMILDDPSVRDKIIDAVLDALPLESGEGREEVERLLDGVARGAGSVGWVGAVSLLYSASGAVSALRYAVNVAWGQRDTRPFVPGKALDVALVLLAVPAVVLALGLRLANAVPAALGDKPLLGGLVAVVVTDLGPMLLTFALLLALFRVLPVRRASWRYAWPGALTATVGIALVQLGAQLAGPLFGDGASVYGTIGAILAAVYAVYVAAILTVYGAHVSAWSARLGDDAAIDRAIADDAAEGEPLWKSVRGAARGLVLRPRSEEEEEEKKKEEEPR